MFASKFAPFAVGCGAGAVLAGTAGVFTSLRLKRLNQLSIVFPFSIRAFLFLGFTADDFLLFRCALVDGKEEIHLLFHEGVVVILAEGPFA
jgi:hypothetical protein